MTNPPTYNYRVDFRPLDVFFFGGETTFGNGEEVNYFAKTRPYPQQTTILGLMRHLGYLRPPSEIGPTDIGESFAAEADENSGRYGFINAVSPLFFTQRGTAVSQHILGPMLSAAQSAAAPLPAGGTVERFGDQGWEQLYELPEFDPKEWYEQPLLPRAENLNKLDDFVKTDTRIGITKQRDGAERTDGFYKQEVGKLPKNGFFSAYLKLAERGKHIAGRHILPVGAEKALFSVEVTALSQQERTDFVSAFPPELVAHCASSHLACAVLLSDAFVESGLLESLPFVVADTTDFRYLSTPKGDQKVSDFGRLSRTDRDAKKYPDQLRMSRKYNLLARGSLLYAEDIQALRDILDLPHWQTIGYNFYHLLSKTA